MAEFDSWRSYWHFSQATSGRFRYVRPPELDEFLRVVLATSNQRQRFLPRGEVLWRAQLGYALEPVYHDGELVGERPCPHPPGRMKPLRTQASEGRINPKGIPCLYLATQRETALAEVRPWLGSLISVARLRTVRDLRVMDCTISAGATRFHLEEPSAKEREETVWAHIDSAFAEPVVASDHAADYVPTQILAELFKVNGYDGIAYRSAVGAGFNLALFDLDAAEIIDCQLYRAERLQFEFAEAASTYVIAKSEAGPA